MGREREAARPSEGCGYLSGILKDAARPFMFRQGVRILLGMIEGGVAGGIIPRSFFRPGFLPVAVRVSTRSGLGTSRSLAHGPPWADHTGRGHTGGDCMVGADESQATGERPSQVPGGRDKSVKDLSGRPDACLPEGIRSNRGNGVVAGPAAIIDAAEESLSRRPDRIQRYQRQRFSGQETGDGRTGGETGSTNRESVRWCAAAAVTAGISELSDDTRFSGPGLISGADARENTSAGGFGQANASGTEKEGHHSRCNSKTPARRPAMYESGVAGPADPCATGPRPRNGFEAASSSDPLSAIAIPGVTTGKREYLLASTDPAELAPPSGPQDIPGRIMPTGNGCSPENGLAPGEVPNDVSDSGTPRQAPVETGATAWKDLPGYVWLRPTAEHRTDNGANGFKEDMPSGIPYSGLESRRATSIRVLPDTAAETEVIADSCRERALDNVERLLQAARNCPANVTYTACPDGNGHDAEPAAAMPMPQVEQVAVITRPDRRSSEPAAFWERSSLGRRHLRPLR